MSKFSKSNDHVKILLLNIRTEVLITQGRGYFWEKAVSHLVARYCV